jgi:uncharacterized protein (TIGR03118 family)
MLKRRQGVALLVSAAIGAAVVLGGGSAGAAALSTYNIHNLVSDGSVQADVVDPALVNPWGLSATATSPWWVSNNGTNSSTLYNAVGAKSALNVSVPGGPTGQVANTSTTAFPVTQGTVTATSRFIFSTEGGQILGWAPTVAATTAVPGVDRSSTGAVYKGLALLNNQLYATDFHHAKVDVFDSAFSPVTLSPTAFKDPQIPKGWAPFGIAAISGSVFVTYAKQDKAAKDDVATPGGGYIDAYSPDGTLLVRVAKAGNRRAPLNSPWGLALAPAGFGGFGGDLLVGNFGDGRISAYQQQSSGRFVYKGQLRTSAGAPIVIGGLWALVFGTGSTAGGSTTSLFFAAGAGGEAHGVFGVITAA